MPAVNESARRIPIAYESDAVDIWHLFVYARQKNRTALGISAHRDAMPVTCWPCRSRSALSRRLPKDSMLAGAPAME